MIFGVLRVLFCPMIKLRFDRLGTYITGLWPLLFGKTFGAKLTDKFLEFLLRLVDLSFNFSKDFRRNIDDFQGKYVFKTQEEGEIIVASVVFGNGEMIVKEEAISDPNVTISFNDADALRRFLFSRNGSGPEKRSSNLWKLELCPQIFVYSERPGP
jgi:hypothetical protein